MMSVLWIGMLIFINWSGDLDEGSKSEKSPSIGKDLPGGDFPPVRTFRLSIKENKST